MQYIYGAIFLISLGLIPLYFVFVHKKQSEYWLFMLFIFVSIVNLGYTLIAFSKTVEFALFSNKIVYLGQVMMPLCMFMIISKLCGFIYKKRFTITLLIVAFLMFSIVCTAGYLDWYYTRVTIENVAGATVLHKEYGILHSLNLIYVVVYFISMIAVLCISLKEGKQASQKHALIMLAVVLGNIAIWCIQKVIPWNFELLSIIYLMSSLAFFGIWLMLQDYINKNDVPKRISSDERISIIFIDSKERAQKIEQIIASLPEGITLTSRQIDVLEGILAGKSRKEMAADLHLSENTIKMHTTSLFKTLKVTCREEIFALIKV